MMTTGWRCRRLILSAVGAALSVAAMVGVGIYGLVAGPETSDPELSIPQELRRTSSAPFPPQGEAEVISWHDLPTMPHTAEPVVYAKAVATGLFSWDTMSGLSPQDYTNPVLVDADPSGSETSGLIRDMDNYLPSDEVWLRLRDYRTQQALTIDRAWIPDSWVEIQRLYPKRLDDGSVAVNIEGTRHRQGIWLGQRHTSTHPVTFTTLLTCRPTYDRCHTLRLSRLGKTLH